jgi:hypothetical protein
MKRRKRDGRGSNVEVQKTRFVLLLISSDTYIRLFIHPVIE